MRRHPVIAVISALAAASLLAACASDEGTESSPSASGSPSASASTPTQEATVAGSDVGFEASGEFGEKPTLTFGSDTAPAGLQVAVASEGDGPEITADDYVTANYYGAVWGSDTPFDNSYDRGTPLGSGLASLITGWGIGLEGQHVGSRILITIPPELGYGPVGGSSDGSIGADDTIVFVVDVIAATSLDALGEADATPTGAEVPVTWDGELGEPVTAVTVADGSAAPAELTGTVLADGTGASIAEGDTLFFQYTLTTWDNADSESSWRTLGGSGVQSLPVGSGSVFDSFVGAHVGSRVLVQVPASQDSEESQALAVVADIVASIPAAG